MFIVVSFSESQITAYDATGPEIASIGGIAYHAYRRLKDIHLQGRRRQFLITEEYRIDSTASPLTLDANASDFQGTENVQVYSGQLSVSWLARRWFFWPISTGNAVCDVVVTLRYRKDGNNQLLYCHDASDPNDANALMCAAVKIPIRIGSRMCAAYFSAKSNFPFRTGGQDDPASFVVRDPAFRVDRSCLFAG